MVNRYMGAFMPALILTGTTIVLQWHAIKFWGSVVGTGIGPVWSITLEALALWLWVQTKSAQGQRALVGLVCIAIIATLMSLMGALMEKGMPLIKEIQTHLGRVDAWELQMASKQREVDSYRKNWMQSVENSATRSGWLGNIEDNKASFTVAQKELERIIANKPSLLALLDEKLQLLMLLLALIVFQTASVLLARRIGECLVADPERESNRDSGGEDRAAVDVPYATLEDEVVMGYGMANDQRTARSEIGYKGLNSNREKSRVLNVGELVERYFTKEGEPASRTSEPATDDGIVETGIGETGIGESDVNRFDEDSGDDSATVASDRVTEPAGKSYTGSNSYTQE